MKLFKVFTQNYKTYVVIAEDIERAYEKFKDKFAGLSIRSIYTIEEDAKEIIQ